MKLHVYITQPEQFIAGDYESCFTMSIRNDWTIRDWIYAGAVDLNIDIDPDRVRQVALQGLDDRIKEIRAVAQKGVDALEQRKQSMLAIEHKSP